MSEKQRRGRDTIKGSAGKRVSGTKKRRKRRRRRRRSPIAGYILFAVAALVFVISAVSLIRIGLEYKKGTDTYDQIALQVVTEEPGEVVPDTETEGDASQEGEKKPILLPQVNFASLKQISQDAEGWIYFPDVGINYPVVYGKDNVYYLTHMIDGTANNAGTLFTDMKNTRGFADTNTIIYGHNMKNGSMFGLLKKYGKEEFYQEHPSFYLYTEEGVWKYDIFSVRVVDECSDSYTLTFASEGDYKAYLDQALRKSMYDTGVAVTSQNPIVTLSTCTSRETDRLIVQAVRGERMQ